ncbi:MAG: hypothetical protein JWP89_1821 [Schlesneria sp.]|nr:hypothetical protein [Schlesneria sp.]
MRWNIIGNAFRRILSPFHWWRSSAPVKDGNSESATSTGSDDADDRTSPQFGPVTNAGPPRHWLERIRLVAPHLLSSLTNPASTPAHPGGKTTRPVREKSTVDEFESQTESRQQFPVAAIVEVPPVLQSNRDILSDSVIQDQAFSERSESPEDVVDDAVTRDSSSSVVRGNLATIEPFPSEQTSRRDAPQFESTLVEAAIASSSIEIRDPFDVVEPPKRKATANEAEPTTSVKHPADKIETDIESAPAACKSSASHVVASEPVDIGKELAQIELKAYWAGIVLPPEGDDSMRTIRPSAEAETIHPRSAETPRKSIAASPSPIAPLASPARHQKPVDGHQSTPAPDTESTLGQFENRSTPTILHRESTSRSRADEQLYQQSERSRLPAIESSDFVRQSSQRELREIEIDKVSRNLWPELPDSMPADDEFVGDDRDRHHRHRLDLEQKGRRWKE